MARKACLPWSTTIRDVIVDEPVRIVMAYPFGAAVSESAVVPSRLDRRKAKTRAALVDAAQQFSAANTTSVSLQEITDAADVCFGSFYNHFGTKDELFAEAVAITLDTWGQLRAEIVAGLEDPVEIFGMSFRMTGRLQRTYPELVRVHLNAGMSVLINDRGLRPSAIADIAMGI